MVGTAYDIVLNQEIQEYARFNAKEAAEKNYKKVELLGVLKEYCSTDGYKDVFVWFPHSGRVLSGMNPMAESSVLTEYCHYQPFCFCPEDSCTETSLYTLPSLSVQVPSDYSSDTFCNLKIIKEQNNNSSDSIEPIEA